MTDEHLTFHWPRGAPLFSFIGLYAFGFLMAAQPELTNPFVGKVAIAMYFVVATLFCIHLYRFRVILDATSLRAGSFFLRKMAFADIVRAQYVQGHDSGQVVLYASDGMRIAIGENLDDFRACARAINARLPTHLSLHPVEQTWPSDVLSGSDLV